MKRVAIQGYEGSFHQLAARAYFGNDVEVIPCATFRGVIKTASGGGQHTGGIMAIENSIAGSILPNYNLITGSGMVITGEIFLKIRQNLMVSPGVTLDDIREVRSHPMALLQCLGYLDAHKWKLVETEDTALSAKDISRHKSKHVAAIASELAATLFDLDIVAGDIQDEKNNYTRFLVLQNKRSELPDASPDKASIHFHIKHESGSLAKILTCFADHSINLTKLQSFPVPGSRWKYSFHTDLEFEDQSQLHKALEKAEKFLEKIKVLGIYKKGKTIQK
jgi:prephenate dehydratase